MMGDDRSVLLVTWGLPQSWGDHGDIEGITSQYLLRKWYPLVI